ncbi:hypothetical protein SRIMM317S_01582 [Streptomyces rimosus subsp. rimosus]
MVGAVKGPLYIRWFVAGVQAGKRPEELFNGNELLLDFCMSNVYQYLNERRVPYFAPCRSYPAEEARVSWPS